MITTRLSGPFGTAEMIGEEGVELWHVTMLGGGQYISRFGPQVQYYLDTSERPNSVHALRDWIDAGVTTLTDRLKRDDEES